MSKRQGTPSIDRRAAVLEAAKDVFSRYGYQRSTMADIAEAARMSRPALYEHFRSKEDVFRSLAEFLCAQALEAAKAAWPAGSDFAEGLTAATLAKDLPFFRLIMLSPHGGELLAQHHALTGNCQADLSSAFAALVASRIGQTKRAKALGRTIVAAIDGLKGQAVSEDGYTEMVRQLCGLLAAGLRAGEKG